MRFGSDGLTHISSSISERTLKASLSLITRSPEYFQSVRFG